MSDSDNGTPLKLLKDNWLRIKINGDEWTVYLVSDDDTVQISEGSACEMDFDDKEIIVRHMGIDVLNLKHELWHCYSRYLFLTDTNNIDLEDLDEIYASLFAYRGALMDSQAQQLYWELIALKKALSDE